ncbi:phosphatidylserine/phosphatidylglycerophosphate/cardiolipin synthase family protein [Qipengyuania sp.]|uniref:phospholipase D-like domain-containing protein n=1 Tax=Qipengyuania sp. TaxID=2004515 RepID=UPI0037359B72
MGDESSAGGAGFQSPPPFSLSAAGQELAFYPGGADRREALFALVDDARDQLDVCFYIFDEDEIGTQFRDALCRAAQRGVDVTLIIDRFGAAASDEFLRPLVESGGRYMCFSRRWTRRYLIRNHQKIVIADRERAMIGGFNIADDYFADAADEGWNDLAIGIEGSALEGLNEWFALLRSWTEKERTPYRVIRRAVRTREWGDDKVRWLIGGPTPSLSPWARDISTALAQGQRLDLIMAYFSPPRTLCRRIGRIARKGQTRLLMAAKSDNGATIGATRALYSGLLESGACIWEFTPTKLHTKLIVLDDTVYLGSANFDMRSLYINLELVLKITDPALAERMREFVSEHLAVSERITPELHRQRATLFNRVRWWAGWVLVSVIDYTITRKLNLGI